MYPAIVLKKINYVNEARCEEILIEGTYEEGPRVKLWLDSSPAQPLRIFQETCEFEKITVNSFRVVQYSRMNTLSAMAKGAPNKITIMAQSSKQAAASS